MFRNIIEFGTPFLRVLPLEMVVVGIIRKSNLGAAVCQRRDGVWRKNSPPVRMVKRLTTCIAKPRKPGEGAGWGIRPAPILRRGE